MRDRAIGAATWTKVSFGDVVRQVKDRVDPAQSGLERYVAGEHMDTDDLRLRRWGDIGDGYLGPAFHMRFKPGHVLYGSRRTYLRKVAVADFDGITANTTYVLEPKDPNVLLPELLPFIMQTEAFNQHSIRESKGSVNPYVNFSDLAWYEFALPPIEEQRRVVSVLGAAGRLEDAHRQLRQCSGLLLQRRLLDSFETGNRSAAAPAHKQWRCRQLSELVAVKHGWAFKGNKFSEKPADGPQLLVPGNFTEYGELDYGYSRSKYYTGEFPDGYILERGDLLVLMTDLTPSARLLGAPGMVEGAVLHNQRLGRVIPTSTEYDAGLLRRFLKFFFMSDVFRRQMRSLSAGSTVRHISPTQICGVSAPIPEPVEMKAFVDSMEDLVMCRDSVERRLEEGAMLLTALRTRLLGS